MNKTSTMSLLSGTYTIKNNITGNLYDSGALKDIVN